MSEDNIKIVFERTVLPYNKGEAAALPADDARILIQKRIAKRYVEPVNKRVGVTKKNGEGNGSRKQRAHKNRRR